MPYLGRLLVIVLAALGTAGVAAAQGAATPTPPDSTRLVAFARAYAAVATLRDQVQHQLAEPANKKGETPAQLREKLRSGIAQLLREHGFTTAEFDGLTHLVSVDSLQRRRFDEALARENGRRPDR